MSFNIDFKRISACTTFFFIKIEEQCYSQNNEQIEINSNKHALNNDNHKWQS